MSRALTTKQYNVNRWIDEIAGSKLRKNVKGARKIKLGSYSIDIRHITIPQAEFNNKLYWICLYITSGWARREISFLKIQSILEIKELCYLIAKEYKCKLPEGLKESRLIYEQLQDHAYTIKVLPDQVHISIADRSPREAYRNCFSELIRFVKEKLTEPEL
jgi:hypothetical protein